MPLCFITVRGVDYQAPDPLVATFTQGSVQGDTMDVTVTILTDEAVEGQHQFTAAVENVSPVIAGPAARIVIMDNYSEYTCLYIMFTMQLLYVWWISLHVCIYNSRASNLRPRSSVYTPPLFDVNKILRIPCASVVRIFQLFIRNKLQNADKYGRIRIGWRLCDYIGRILFRLLPALIEMCACTYFFVGVCYFTYVSMIL